MHRNSLMDTVGSRRLVSSLPHQTIFPCVNKETPDFTSNLGAFGTCVFVIVFLIKYLNYWFYIYVPFSENILVKILIEIINLIECFLFHRNDTKEDVFVHQVMSLLHKRIAIFNLGYLK